MPKKLNADVRLAVAITRYDSETGTPLPEEVYQVSVYRGETSEQCVPRISEWEGKVADAFEGIEG